MGEASGVKSLEGDRGHLTTDRLRAFAQGRLPPRFSRAPRCIRQLAARTARSTKLCSARAAPGRIQEGGGGEGRASSRTMSVFLRGGPTSRATIKKSPTERHESAARHQAIRDAPPGPLQAHEVRTQLTLHANAAAEAAGAWKVRVRAPPVSRKDHRTRIRCRHRKEQNSSPFELLRSESARGWWTARQRAKAHRAMVLGRWEYAIRFLGRNSRGIEVSIPLSKRPTSWLPAARFRGGIGPIY